jgi:hypothetical protein
MRDQAGGERAAGGVVAAADIGMDERHLAGEALRRRRGGVANAGSYSRRADAVDGRPISVRKGSKPNSLAFWQASAGRN